MEQTGAATGPEQRAGVLLQTLMTIYIDERRSANLNEQFRESSSRIVIGANTLLIATAIGIAGKPLAVALCVIALVVSHIGQKMALRYYTVTERYYIRARQLRAQISELATGDKKALEELLQPTEATFAAEFAKRPMAKRLMKLRKERLFMMWYQLHALFKLVAALLAVAMAYPALISAYELHSGSLGEALSRFPS